MPKGRKPDNWVKGELVTEPVEEWQLLEGCTFYRTEQGSGLIYIPPGVVRLLKLERRMKLDVAFRRSQIPDAPETGPIAVPAIYPPRKRGRKGSYRKIVNNFLASPHRVIQIKNASYGGLYKFLYRNPELKKKVRIRVRDQGRASQSIWLEKKEVPEDED